jgi:hypothetical protein
MSDIHKPVSPKLVQRISKMQKLPLTDLIRAMDSFTVPAKPHDRAALKLAISHIRQPK